MIKHINENEFEREVLNEDKLVVVDFFATWCGPCKMLASILEEVQEELKEVKIVKIDIDKNPNSASKYKVRNIPTIKIFKNGEEVKNNVGFASKEALISMIEKA